ncbi:MAG TPA: ABC transporter substrate-binding protein [Candidatus Sulfotelmatobacter sp.]|nr:ABC transporter substrate-binding protein [Candidatus Sulfotelmatobacter sp.]
MVPMRGLVPISLLVGFACMFPVQRAQGVQTKEERMVTGSAVGQPGGTITVAVRSDPKTLNPVLAVDESTREIIDCMNADLIHINRETQKTEPALAKSWSISRDGKIFILHLRRGLEFSDGQPFTADDVVFSFQVYLDEKIHSPQRDLLVVGGKPVSVKKIDELTVEFQLTEPYAAAERIFDGLAILPKHILETAYRNGTFSKLWGVSMPPNEFAGLGAFRLKEYVPGQRIVLERNPHYWKADRAGRRLPYIDQLVFLFVPSEDAQVIRFQAGDTDLLSRLSAENFAVLQREQTLRGYKLEDLGPGLEYNFLFFNLNNLTGKKLPEIERKQAWFEDTGFRQAVSAAIDRDGIVRLVYNGRATPLWSQVTPGNKLWVDSSLAAPPQSLDRARELLRTAHFSWNSTGDLLDARGRAVEFSILTSSSNAERSRIATLIQDDLTKLGMKVHVVSLDFSAMVDRLLNSFDYEAAVMGLASGDADPESEMNVWLSSGGTHLWNLTESKPATPWEAEIDRLMNQQQVTLDYKRRKHLYDQVQQIVAQELPLVCLASPHILVGAKNRVGNFHPAILAPYVLANVDELYVH